MHLRGDFDPHYFPPLGDDRHSFSHHRNGFVPFVGQYLAEPAHRAYHSQDSAEGTHCDARQQTGEE